MKHSFVEETVSSTNVDVGLAMIKLQGGPSGRIVGWVDFDL